MGHAFLTQASNLVGNEYHLIKLRFTSIHVHSNVCVTNYNNEQYIKIVCLVRWSDVTIEYIAI